MSKERMLKVITTMQSFSHNHLLHFALIGGFVYLPLINEQYFGWIIWFLGVVTNIFVPAGDVMTVGFMVARIIHRICGFGVIIIATTYFLWEIREARKWEITKWKLSKLKADVMNLYNHYFRGEHVEFGRYNPGQLLFFWGFILPVVVVASVTGLILVFKTAFSTDTVAVALFLHDAAFFWGLVGGVFHVVAGVVIPENRPAATAMFRTGEFPESYMKEHHSLWYKRILEKKSKEK